MITLKWYNTTYNKNQDMSNIDSESVAKMDLCVSPSLFFHTAGAKLAYLWASVEDQKQIDAS